MSRVLFALMLLLMGTPAWAAIAEVGSGSQRAKYSSNNDAGEDASSALSFPGNVTSGNKLIVAFTCWRGSGAPASCGISDSQGNSYTVVSGTTGNWRVGIACATAGSTGANSVTLNPTGGANDFIAFVIDEFSGITSCTPDVDGGLATGTATTSPSTTITTTTDNSLVVGFYTPTTLSSNTTIAEGSGLTLIGEDETCNGNPNGNLCYSGEFKVAGTAGSVTVNWTTGTSLAYGIYRVSYAPTAASSTSGISRSRAIFLGE